MGHAAEEPKATLPIYPPHSTIYALNAPRSCHFHDSYAIKKEQLEVEILKQTSHLRGVSGQITHCVVTSRLSSLPCLLVVAIGKLLVDSVSEAAGLGRSEVGCPGT